MVSTVVAVVLVLDLNSVRDRNIEDLSGGELQRFACAVVCIQKECYIDLVGSVGMHIMDHLI